MSAGEKKQSQAVVLNTVLILDKDVGSLKLIQIYVENLGARHVLKVQEPEDAWRYLNSQHIDLVVTDWKMKAPGGTEFYERIRSNPKMLETPIILVSGFVTKNDIEITKKDSKTRFLVKPFPEDLFLESVHQLFGVTPPVKSPRELTRHTDNKTQIGSTPYSKEKSHKQSDILVLKGDGRTADRGIEVHKGHETNRNHGIEVHDGPASIAGRGTIVQKGEDAGRGFDIGVQKGNQPGSGQNLMVQEGQGSKHGLDIEVQEGHRRSWGMDITVQQGVKPNANNMLFIEKGVVKETGADGASIEANATPEDLACNQPRPRQGEDFATSERKEISSGWAVRINREENSALDQGAKEEKLPFTDRRAGKTQADVSANDLRVNHDLSLLKRPQSQHGPEAGHNTREWSISIQKNQSDKHPPSRHNTPAGSLDIDTNMKPVQRAPTEQFYIEHLQTDSRVPHKNQEGVPHLEERPPGARMSGSVSRGELDHGDDSGAPSAASTSSALSGVAAREPLVPEIRRPDEPFRSVLEVNGYFDNPPGILELFPANPRRVMVIDNDPAQLNVIESYLRTLGTPDVEKYTDAQDAWQALSHGRYDMVIMEWRLKVMSGLCLYNRIRNSRKMARLPLIVMTGFLHKEDLRLLDENSYTNVLEKPLQLKPFLKILSTTIEEANTHTKSLNRAVELMNSFGSNPPDLSIIVEKMPIERSEAAQFVLSAAQYFFCEGKYVEAEKMLKAALRLKPDSIEVKCELAKVYHRTNRPSDALTILKSAEKKAPGAIERLCLIGELGLKLNHIEDARASFKKVLKIDKEHQLAKDGATISDNMLDYIEGYGRKSLTEKFASSLNIIGITLVRNNKIREGIEQYRAATSFVDELLILAKLNFNIGLAYLRWGSLEEAEAWLRNADRIAKGELPKAGIYADRVSDLRKRGNNTSEDLSKDIANILTLNGTPEQG